jgi:hypothetical protein
MNELKNNISSILPGLSMAFPINHLFCICKNSSTYKKRKRWKISTEKKSLVRQSGHIREITLFYKYSTSMKICS